MIANVKSRTFGYGSFLSGTFVKRLLVYHKTITFRLYHMYNRLEGHLGGCEMQKHRHRKGILISYRDNKRDCRDSDR